MHIWREREGEVFIRVWYKKHGVYSSMWVHLMGGSVLCMMKIIRKRKMGPIEGKEMWTRNKRECCLFWDHMRLPLMYGIEGDSLPSNLAKILLIICPQTWKEKSQFQFLVVVWKLDPLPLHAHAPLLHNITNIYIYIYFLCLFFLIESKNCTWAEVINQVR